MPKEEEWVSLNMTKENSHLDMKTYCKPGITPDASKAAIVAVNLSITQELWTYLLTNNPHSPPKQSPTLAQMNLVLGRTLRLLRGEGLCIGEAS